MDFESTGLSQPLLQAVGNLGFTKPMPVQAEVLPILLSESTDLVGLAQTGTGKTAAFGLPLLQRIDLGRKHTQSVILCPTRELCMQITGDLQNFGRFLDGLNVVAVYGGAPIGRQITLIRKGAQVIVATPGRLLDLMRRKVVQLNQVSYAVLDEADEMLNMGFQEDIDAILSTLPDQRNVWLFSATMPKGVARIAKNYLTNPREVTIGKANVAADNITHSYCVVHEKHRYQALKRMMDFYPRMYGLIFCRTRQETKHVAENLLQDGYVAEALHGDLSQDQRDTVMRKFRAQAVRALVATDVAARGLDVDDITHIIHYRLPEDPAIYTHRSGRTARAGKSGASIAILNLKESWRIRDLERGGMRFEAIKIPSGRAICEKQLFYLVEKIVNTKINQKEIEGYLPAVSDALRGFSKEELIQRLVSAEFARFLDYYRHSDDINVTDRRGKGRHAGERTERDKPGKRQPRDRAGRKMENAHRFTINVGKSSHVGAGAIVRLVCENSGIPSEMIGGIKLDLEHSTFEVERHVADQVKASLKNAKIDGHHVRVSDEGERREMKGKQERKAHRNERPRPAGKRAPKKHRKGGKRPPTP
jgi:ATP-dependent RNA helicase DeaD